MYLSDKTKQLLEKTIGKSISELNNMSFDDEIAYVTQKYGRSPVFSKKADSRMVSRGNPLLARKRICTMDDVDEKIMRL